MAPKLLVKYVNKYVDLKDYTVILPSVSVGNIGQLTCDLVIYNYGFKKVGVLWHPAIMSTVGGDPYDADSEDLCTGCELYVNEEIKHAVIQIRSGIEVQLANHFFACLKMEFKEQQVKDIIILAGCFGWEMKDSQIREGIVSQFRFLTSWNLEKIASRMDTKFGLKALLKDKITGKYHAPGSGFAMRLYDLLTAERNMSVAVIFKYVSEGDNIPDAVLMFNHVIRICKFAIKEREKDVEVRERVYKDWPIGKYYDVHFPPSWNQLWGNEPPMQLFF